MGKLQELIQSLNKEELRTFTIYSNRVKTSDRDGKKILLLFNRIKDDGVDDNNPILAEELYNGNKNAYYRLKNRLTEDIEKSLLMLHSSFDKQTRVTNYINLAKVFQVKSNYQLAINFLLKAEKISIDQEYFNLLRFIYSEIILICSSYSEINPQLYIDKLDKLEEEHSKLKDINRVIATINYQLKRSNFGGKDQNVVNTLSQLLSEIEVEKKILNSFRYKLRINEVVRNILLQKKDFESLEIYLKSSLAEFNDKKWFKKETHHHKVIWLSWLINTLSKLKKFEESLKYTKELFQALNAHGKIHLEKYIWTYYQSLVINYTYSGKSSEAIEVLEKLAKDNKYKGEPFYDVFVYLNLTTLHFCEGDISAALKSLKNIIIKEVFSKLTPNVRLHVSIVEAIIHFERGNIDYVYSKIEEIRKKFKLVLKEESFNREQLFLKLLKDLVGVSKPFESKRFISKYNEFLKLMEKEELGSNEAINYLAYLKSKENKKEYYSELLKML